MEPDPGFAIVQAEWARLLLGSFADAGVRDVVISPGSRSTPYVVAAAREPRLRSWDLVDERSAAFFALGKARMTGKPALLLCTSGTAAANYLPAVVEAGAASVPLLVLTADRPVELADCGANQTVDQIKLYGDHARRFVDLGAPSPSPLALRALRRTAAQAFLTSRHPEPGAVHLNARAAKPLEPREPRTDAETRLCAEVDRLLQKPIVEAPRPLRFQASDSEYELSQECRRHERGLIVCGPTPLTKAPVISELAIRVARHTGYPIYFEPASQGRFLERPEESDAVFVDALDTLLHSTAFRSEMAPDLLLQIGRPPTSKVWERYLDENPDCRHWVLDEWRWSDSRSTADRLLIGDLGPALSELVQEFERSRPRPPTAWTERFRDADERAWEIADAELAGGELSEGAAVRMVAGSLPAGSLLAVGNSLPIRLVDTWCRGGGADLRVWSQRGASGIDGVISGAAGAASEHGDLTALLIGDLSFLHDLSGLAAARRLEQPFVVVVLQNRGGRIFEQLPLAGDEAAEGIFDHWTTPHDFDFSHAAALFGLPYERASTLDELRGALDRAYHHDGATVVEVMVPPHGAVAQNRRLWQAVDEMLAARGTDPT